MGYLETLGWGWLLVAAMMLVLWAVQLRRGDAGVVDVGWAAGLGLIALLAATVGDGLPLRRALLAGMVGFWSFRLAGYLLLNRVIGKPEDGRYRTLRAAWGERANRNFLWFFQAQGVLDVVLAVPFVLIAFNPGDTLHPLEWAAMGLWCLAIAGESVADAQLARWRADPGHQGKTCRAGLWRYSRHPNYFCEWLIWCAYALLAWTAPYGWLGLLSPALMLLLIVKVTGIPPTEAQALLSRGEDYRHYQHTTSAFFPWFPRRESLTPDGVKGRRER